MKIGGPVRRLIVRFAPVVVLIAAQFRAGAAPSPGSPPAAPAESQLAKEAVSILRQNCAACHSGASPNGGMRVSSRQDLLKGGASGPAVNLSKPDTSLLLKAVNYHGRQMPPAGKLPQAQIETL